MEASTLPPTVTQCRICEQTSKPLRKGRCHRCNEYFRRNGEEWSPEAVAPLPPRVCCNCGALTIHPCMGRCHACDAFWRRNQSERPVTLSSCPADAIPIVDFPDYRVDPRGDLWCEESGHPRGRWIKMRLMKQRTGYLQVKLSNAAGPKRKLVHRIVLETFVGPCPADKQETAHWNGKRSDNRVENLRWATKKENYDDAVRHGTRTRKVKR